MKNINEADKKEILDKHKNLLEIKEILKDEFVGLDDIIDEICNLVEPWYLFPNAQIRPTIINLWGLTSTGKTSLIQRMFELLEINSLLRFDTGEWVDKTDFELRNKISGQVRKVQKDNMIPIFVFDEFQLGRTLDEVGDEIDRPSLRVIWDLLDSGKFDLLEEKWETTSVMNLYTKLNFLINTKKVEVKNGKITKNKNEWDIIFLEDEEDISEDKVELIEKHYSVNAFIPANKLWNIKSLNDEKFYSEIQLCDYLMSLNGEEILIFLEKSIEKSIRPVEHDFSNSIIFNIGNLDDAYYSSNDMSPDIDADTLYEYTTKINLADIKRSLKKLYRSEQLSRLGNNHVIYKSFNQKMYEDIIILELNKIKSQVDEKFGVEVEFDTTINDLLYRESVFPTQGVRPIFSTLTSLIESYVGRIIVDALKQDIDLIKIKWEYVNDEYSIILISPDGETKLNYKIQLKVDNIRRTKGDDSQALIGIHESGHIINSIFALNICPKMAVSRTANDNGGFTHVDMPDWDTKEVLTNEIITLLGGYCAEKLVFGEGNLTTGSYSDIDKTTKTAVKIIKEYGMNGMPLMYSVPDFRVSDATICLLDDSLDKLAVELVKTCMRQTEKTLTDNMELLLRLGQHLTDNSKIEADEIKEFVEKYATYEPTYKTKEDYYEYKSTITNLLKNYGKI